MIEDTMKKMERQASVTRDFYVKPDGTISMEPNDIACASRQSPRFNFRENKINPAASNLVTARKKCISADVSSEEARLLHDECYMMYTWKKEELEETKMFIKRMEENKTPWKASGISLWKREKSFEEWEKTLKDTKMRVQLADYEKQNREKVAADANEY